MPAGGLFVAFRVANAFGFKLEFTDVHPFGFYHEPLPGGTEVFLGQCGAVETANQGWINRSGLAGTLGIG